MNRHALGSLQDKKILIVDDDPVFCDFAATALQREGARTSTQRDGADALAYFEGNDCDLAIVDLIMPRVDGLRLISVLRHMPKTRQLPVVVVTSRRDAAAHLDAERLDVALFLNKPIRWTQFAQKIQGVLEETPGSPDAARQLDVTIARQSDLIRRRA